VTSSITDRLFDTLVVSKQGRRKSMTNIAVALKAEIARISRKTVKQDLTSLRAVAATQRTQIAALKGQVSELLKALGRLEKGQTKQVAKQEPNEDGATIRFSAKGLAVHRQKLGISAQDYAQLVGASALSVYKWESGKAKPRRPQLEALASVRGMGKRAALAKLEELNAGR